jgi:internalin A
LWPVLSLKGVTKRVVRELRAAYLVDFISLIVPRVGRMNGISALSGLTKLTEVEFGGLRESERHIWVSRVENLTNLNLSECWSLTDISPLTSLTNLTHLNFRGCKSLENISALAGAPNLT